MNVHHQQNYLPAIEDRIDRQLLLSHGQNPHFEKNRKLSGWLLGLNGEHLGEDLRLYEGMNSIGCSAWSDIVITSPDAGRDHAQIQILANGIAFLRPGSSHRRLWLNEAPINQSADLHHGDIILCGEQYFAFVSLLPKEQIQNKFINLGTNNEISPFCTYAWLIELISKTQKKDYRLFSEHNHLGNQKGLEIHLSDNSISETQCIISHQNNTWTIKSCASIPSLLINGTSEAQAVLLNGDHIVIGHREFVFRSFAVRSKE
jgi:pSer/pThr/pTyr-binding forkhead associated (FHA) protein